MANQYKTPLLGNGRLGNYTPPLLDTSLYWEYTNRLEATKTNDLGQVYESDVFLSGTQHTNFANNGLSLQNRTAQFTVVGESDKPMAILAIPSTYGNIRFTERGQYAQTWAGAAAGFHNMPTFQYYLLAKNGGAPLRQRYGVRGAANSNGVLQYRRAVDIVKGGYTEETGYTTSPPAISSFSTNNISVTDSVEFLVESTMVGFSTALLAELQRQNSNTVNGVKWYCYDQNVGMVDTDVITRLGALIGEWAALPNSVLSDVHMCSLLGMQGINGGSIAQPIGSPVTYKYIGTQLSTGFPVFTLDSFDQMVRYFQGDSWIADNGDLPPSDWSTDWDIYIKGAQKPDIFITMKSDKVDEWLENLDENKSGITKSDIKVEYRYRAYPDPKSAQPAPVNVLYGTQYTLTDWLKDEYNKQRDTAFIQNIALNYPLSDQIVFANEFVDMDVIQFQYYAQLEFRIHYGQYKSTWCRYKIGVIGSPSVPDFVQMKNEGVQDDDWQDNSTVTLHYDEYPEGYNPYPTPPNPPVPLPNPTYPAPSQNGLGLLTTTYKVTPDNAKALGRFLWGKSAWLNELKALNFSPIENIVGMKIMPIDISGSTSAIFIGNVDTNINADKIESIPLYKVGELTITGRYQSFLDYAPTTKMSLFLPFVGFVPLDPQFVTNKKLEVIYSFDIIAGVCNAMIFCNGVYVESHQGNCGIDIPLVASNRAEMEIGLATSLATTAASIAAAPATGGASVAVGARAAGSTINSLSSYATGFHTQRQGGYSPTCAWTETRECFIVIETPNAAYSSTYAHDYGRPCMATYTISQLSGFTVCEQTVDLSGISGATEEEKSMIKELLTSGFYA